MTVCGVPEEEKLEGRSLIDLANTADDPERLVTSEYHAMGAPSSAFMLRRGPLKFNYYEGYDPELFDLEADPEETKNLAEDAASISILDEFEAILRDRIDPGTIDRLAKNDMAALIESFGGREKAMDLGRTGSTPVPGQASE